jgi:hypothetical protein
MVKSYQVRFWVRVAIWSALAAVTLLRVLIHMPIDKSVGYDLFLGLCGAWLLDRAVTGNATMLGTLPLPSSVDDPSEQNAERRLGAMLIGVLCYAVALALLLHA